MAKAKSKKSKDSAEVNVDGTTVEFAALSFSNVDELHRMLHVVLEQDAQVLASHVREALLSNRFRANQVKGIRKLLREGNAEDLFMGGIVAAVSSSIHATAYSVRAAMQVGPEELGTSYASALKTVFLQALDRFMVCSSLLDIATTYGVSRDHELLSIVSRQIDEAAHEILMPLAETLVAATVVPEGSAVH